MVAKPVTIDTRSFPTKDAARAFFKEMLNRYRPGDRVSDSDAVDLRALLKLHTEYPAKLGYGIDHFEVMSQTVDGITTQCFEIVRVDRTRDDFSYGHCITPKKG
jgi:hypothetical protein